jgi:hypothetical protein
MEKLFSGQGYAQNRVFFGSVFEILDPNWAGVRAKALTKTPQNPKMLKLCYYESFDQNCFSGFSRTLKGSAKAKKVCILTEKFEKKTKLGSKLGTK